MQRLTIGEFARASGLTPKALRLYDDLGLMRPAAVDPRSGYRAYGPDQLGRARLIAALRAIGMPLARIRAVCDGAPGSAAVEIRSYWRQVEADTRARAEQVRLLVDALTREDLAMNDTLGPVLEHAARRHRGFVREHDEDAVLTGDRLFAVADGFGLSPATTSSPSHGARAAAAALEALASCELRSSTDPVGALAAGVADALQAVRDLGDDGAAPGSTLTAMLWSGHRYGVAHVGDTRLYRLRAGELSLVTHDHTYAWSLVDEARLTPEEVASHPERATLLRGLHRDLPADPDLHLREAHVEDRYLLCSDGVHAVLGEDELRTALTSPQPVATVADELLDRVLDRGAPDNLAVVLVDVLPGA